MEAVDQKTCNGNGNGNDCALTGLEKALLRLPNMSAQRYDGGWWWIKNYRQVRLHCIAGPVVYSAWFGMCMYQSFVRSDVCAPWRAAESASSLRTSKQGGTAAEQREREE